MSRSVITLLTDFGTSDYYAGALKGTLLRLAPSAVLVDISHEVDPGNIEQGCFLLGASHPHFPKGTVHLAVVDPGVGGSRRILAARSESGFFVAPDNGILSSLPQNTEFRVVEAEDLFLGGPGDTFHGRDRFAPVAGYLALGRPFAALGRIAVNPVVLSRKPPERGEGFLSGRVTHIDRFGNLITDIPSDWFPADGKTRFECHLPSLEIRRWASHYDDLAPGEAGLIPGSLGTLEVSLRRESAAAQCGIRPPRNLLIRFR